MGVIASKFAFFPPNPPAPLHQNCFMETTINAVYIPMYFIRNQASPYLLIFSHGNAEDLTHTVPLLNEISQKLQVSVLGYEYVGYPHCSDAIPRSTLSSQPSPSEEGCYESIITARIYAQKTLKFDDAHIIWMGHSIGCGPTVEMAARLGREQIHSAGVILISPFDSAVSLFSPFLAHFYDIFCNGAKIPLVIANTLIIHGEQDDVIPAMQSETLEKKAVNCQISRYVLERAGHNDIFSFPETWNIMATFIGLLKK